MEIHNLTQGTPAWHAYRNEKDNASDAPAMMGASPYKKRADLLKERHTGLAEEIDAGTQARFDDGHRFEALARPLAEEIVGEALYPVTGSSGTLSASFDGITMDESVVFEHKSLNNDIRATETGAGLPLHLRIQMEQQLMISGAEKCLFLASKWDGTDRLVEKKHFWYTPDLALREQIVAGWAQFRADLAAYAPKTFTPKAVAEPIMSLPALAIHIKGEVTLSNLPAFKAKADTFIASIKTDLLTDEDFANAEETIKFCDTAEKNIEQTKDAAIAQTASIDELMCTLDHISAQLREKRLLLTRTVKDKKELLKADILNKAKLAFADHVTALEQEIAPIRMVFQARDFAGAMKNKRTLKSLHDAVDTELAAGKITVDALAKAVRGRLTWYKDAAAGNEQLFADLQQLIQKPDDDFKLVVNTRIADHKTKEAEKVAAAVELATAQAAPAGADLSPAAQTLNEEQGAARFVVRHSAIARMAPTSAPTLRLGQIVERLGFTVTADFLRSLGFEPAARDKAACLYHDADFDHICRALVRHITSIQQKQAA